jgi:hypothetical protein
VRVLRRLLIVVVVAVLGTAGIGLAWTAIGGGALPLHGWIALSLGVLGTVALTWGLMALAFRSDREGWDQRADRTGGADIEDGDKP